MLAKKPNSRKSLSLLLLFLCISILLFRQSKVNLWSTTKRFINYDTINITKHANDVKRRRVSFVPFPYKSLGSGEAVECTWETGGIHHYFNRTDIIGSESDVLDSIQAAAYKEGICTPNDPKLASSLHIFSQSEAVECLSPTIQQRNISVIISGDSYTRQLFIGLADVLLGRPSTQEITGQKLRLDTLYKSNEDLAFRHGNDSSYPNVQYKCFHECYGNYGSPPSFSIQCSNCINNYTMGSNDSVSVVGAGVHVLTYFNNQVNKLLPATERGFKPTARDVPEGDTIAAVNETIKDFERFFNLSKNLIYVSMPSYDIEKVPVAYKNASHNTYAGVIHRGLLPYLAPQNMQHPFIDVFQLTRACYMKNCSYDGGHRSRYVNRFKAQLLLNTLCEVHN